MSASRLALFKSLKNNPAYKELQFLWLEDISEIEAKRDVSASRGQESAWRYAAGQEKGAKKIVTRLDEEIMRLEDLGGDTKDEPSEVVARLLDEARGESKP